MPERAYAAAVWALWALACLLFGLAVPFACWMAAALLGRPAPPNAEPVGLLTGGLAFAAIAPRVRAQLRRDD